jgi:hypothetical protein
MGKICICKHHKKRHSGKFTINKECDVKGCNCKGFSPISENGGIKKK